MRIRRKKKRILAVLLLISSLFILQMYRPALAIEFEDYVETQSDPEIIESLEEPIKKFKKRMLLTV